MWHVYATEQYAPHKALRWTPTAVTRSAPLRSALCAGVPFQLPPVHSPFVGDGDTTIEAQQSLLSKSLTQEKRS